MSIKKDNVSATAVKYNNQDVNKVILDNKCVWCKAFTYTQGTLPTGVASFTCTRSSTDEPTASTGTISNGGTIYYDDKLYWTATASTGYRITAVKGSSSPVTVSGAVTGTSASGLASARISGTISQGTLPTGVASIKCYRKAYNGSSFSEYTGSTIYYGDQFYWTATASTGYKNPSLTYNSSSKAYTWNGSQGGAITSVGNSGLSAGSRRSFTVSFGTTANKTLYGSWSKSSQTAYYGDKITVSGTTVICYKWDATSTERWRVTVTPSSNTAQYTYSAVTIAGSSNIESVAGDVVYTASNTRTTNSYTITWKYLSAYPDTWTTATEAYTYGATPSRTASTVTSGSFRKVSTGWDSLATVTGNRTITANYKTQVNATFSGTRCSGKIDGAVPSNGWWDVGKKLTWTANTNCAFSSNGSTTTATETISTQKTAYTATAAYINVTSVNGNNCTAYTDNTYTTAFTTGWKSYGVSIYWKASAAYAFDTSNRETNAGLAVPGANTANANIVKQYKLTISATNGSYGTYSVSRTKSPYQSAATGTLSNGATIYYGDTLTGTSSAKAVSYDGWSVTSVTAPTFTTTGDATSGNLTIKNNSSYSATLYYNTSNAVGGTSAGTAPANTPKIVTGLDFNKQYYISARVSRTRTKYTYATDGTQYSGTSSVTGNITASFKFKRTNTTESGTIDSSVVAAKTAAQNTYTITWKYLKAYPDTWEQVTQTYAYGATPSRTTPSTVTSGNERKVFASWDSLAIVTGNRTITATYNTQFAPTIVSSCCTADKISGKWYAAGTTITWTANDNYSFGGSAVKDTTTTTIQAGNVTYSKAPGYVKCTISGTRCTANKTSGSILAVNTQIIWTSSTGYSYTEQTSTPTNPDPQTVALGTTSYSAVCDYVNVTFNPSNCTSTGASKKYLKIGSKVTWNANTNYAFDSNGTKTLDIEIPNYSTNFVPTAGYGYYTLNLTNCTYQSGSKAGWYTTSSKPSTVVKASSGWSFGGSSQDTRTIGGTATVPTTVSASPEYFYITFSPTNCNPSVQSGYFTSSTRPSSVTWTPTQYYSFASGTTQTNSTTTLSTNAPNTYSASPQYVRVASIATGTYNASVDKNANTYYAPGSTITWTAKTNYYYGSSSSNTTTTNGATITAGATISAPNPTHIKCTISGTNCGADKTTGSILAVNTQITWTRNTGSNYKYSFSNTNADSTTSTAKVALGTTSYSKTASYLWYNVTITPATNCTANKSSGYLLKDSTVTFTATTATSSVSYSFSNTNVTDFTKSATVTSAGQTISSGTVYTWYNVTFSGTNCAANKSSGWYLSDTTFTWTATTNYAFDSSGTKTSAGTITQAGSYGKTAQYGFYDLNTTNCVFSLGHKEGYYLTSTSLSTSCVANSGWSFRGSTEADSQTLPTSGTTKNAPCSQSFSPSYFKLTITGTNCTPNKQTNFYNAAQTITWTAATDYAFDSLGTKAASVTTSAAPGSYSKTPTYGQYNVYTTNCTANVSTGWYSVATNKTTTYTANDGWSFGGTSVKDTTTRSAAVPGSVSATPGYCKIKVTGTNCTIKVGGTTRASNWEGIVANGTTIVYTANTNYAFDASGTSTKSVTVTGPNTYNAAPTHGYFTVTPQNCTATVASGWYAITSSKNVKFTANDGWSFAGTSVKDSTTKSGAVPGTIAASPTYFYITVNGTNCTPNTLTGMRKATDTNTITWTAASGYAFDTSGTTTKSQTVTAPGTYSKSPGYGYYTLNLTNCSYKSGDKAGWYALGSTPTTTVAASPNWSFNGSAGSTKVVGGIIPVPATASASPNYFYLIFSPTNCTCSASSGYYTSSTKPSEVTWTPTTYYSFEAGTTQKTTKTTISVNSPNTYSASPQYIRAASIATGTYNSSVNKNANTYYAANTAVTWTAATNYYYGSSSSNTTSTNNNTKITAGATITAPTPTHIKCTISGTNCTANKTTGSILPLDTTITWTVSGETTDYKYSFSSTDISDKTRTAKVALGTTSYSKSASNTYFRVTVSPSGNCTADKSSGYLLNGSKVTFTIPAAVNTTSKRYSFSTSNSTTTTCTKTVSSPGQTLANDTAYVWMNCTFSGTNCSKPTNGWYRAGTTSPDFTATTATNIKYSFTNTSASTPTTTANVTIVDGTTAYTKNASYEYYNVTITKGTDTASSNYTSGYYLKGTTVTFSAKTSTSTVRYSYSNTASGTNTQSYTVSSAGQKITSGTVYTWYNVTSATGTNCTAYLEQYYWDVALPTGWYLRDTPIYWKASAAYAFDESNTDVYTTTVAAGANTASANFVKRYTLTLTKNSHVQAISVWKTSSPYAGASVGSYADPLLSGTGTTMVYYGDTLAGSAGAESPGYHFGNDNSIGVQSWTQTVTGNVTWAPTPSANKYDITFNGTMCNWTYSSCVSEYGDRIKTSLAARSATLTCYIGVSSSVRWTNTVTLTQVAINAGMKLQVTGYTEDTPIADNITINATGVKNVTPITTCKYTLSVSDSLGITGAYLSTNASSTATSGSTTVTANTSTKVYVYFTLTHDMHTTHLSAYTLRSGTAGKAGALYRSTTGHTSSTATKTLTLSLGWDEFDILGLRTGSKVGSIDFTTPGIVTADGYSLTKSGSTVSATYTDFNGVSKTVGVCTYTVPNGYTGTLYITNRNGANKSWNTYIDGSNGPYIIVLETAPSQSSGT